MVSDYGVNGSVALKWLIDDEADISCARTIPSDILTGNTRLLAPPHYISEFGNGLIMATRCASGDSRRPSYHSSTATRRRS